MIACALVVLLPNGYKSCGVIVLMSADIVFHFHSVNILFKLCEMLWILRKVWCWCLWMLFAESWCIRGDGHFAYGAIQYSL